MHGQLVSELKGTGGCHFLANREGLIWSEEAGGELGGDRFTIKTSNPFYVSSFFSPSLVNLSRSICSSIKLLVKTAKVIVFPKSCQLSTVD